MQEQKQFVIQTQEEWAQFHSYNLTNTAHGVSLQQHDVYILEQEIPLSNQLSIRSMAIDPSNGEFYLLTDEAAIYTYDHMTGLTQPFILQHDYFTPAAQLVSMGKTLYVLDAQGKYKITALTQFNGQLLWFREHTIADIPFHPVAITTKHKSLYLLIYNTRTEAHELLQLSPHGELQGRIALPALAHLPADARLSLRIGDNGMFYLFHYPLKVMYVVRGLTEEKSTHQQLKGKELGKESDDRDSTPQEQADLIQSEQVQLLSFRLTSPSSSFVLDTQGIIYIGENDSSVTQTRGSLLQSHNLYDFHFLNSYRGTVGGMFLNRYDHLYIWNPETSSFYLLKKRNRSLATSTSQSYYGMMLTKALDSRESETEWDRFEMEATIPSECQIKVSYYASDTKKILIDGQFYSLDDYITRGEIDSIQKINSTSTLWSAPVSNPRDIPLPKVKGRYLWLKLEWFATEKESPTIHRIQISFPGQSIVEYLPNTYQNHDEQGFLKRYLALFGNLYFELEQEIDEVSRHLNPLHVSLPFLKWLGSWLGMKDADMWPEEKLRAYMKELPELYQLRGTKTALTRVLELYTGQPPLIIENAQLQQSRQNQEIEVLINQLYHNDPFHFCVIISPNLVEGEHQKVAVQTLVHTFKPAFTAAKIIFLEPWIFMDKHTYLGMNTYLSEPNLLRLNNRTTIPFDTTIIDVDSNNQLDRHTRLGMNSSLDD